MRKSQDKVLKTVYKALKEIVQTNQYGSVENVTNKLRGIVKYCEQNYTSK